MVNIVVYISPHFFLNPVAKKQTLEPLTYNFLLSEIIKYIPFYVKKKIREEEAGWKDSLDPHVVICFDFAFAKQLHVLYNREAIQNKAKEKCLFKIGFCQY